MLDALADLRHRWLQAGPAYPGGADALAFHRAALAPMLAQGEAHSFTQPDGRLGAAVLVHREAVAAHYLAPLTHLVAHHDGSPAAVAWLARTLDAVVPGLPDDVDCMVPVADAITRGLLLARGLGDNALSLAGPVAEGRRALFTRWNPPRDLSHRGLELVPMEPGHADAVVALIRRVFTAEPAYGWFMSGDAFLEERRQRVIDGRGPVLSMVLLAEGRLVGFFEGGLKPEDPHHGSSVGVGLVLDRPARGLGAALVAYRLVLDLALERGARWIKGTTGRREVLHMGAVMGRRPTGLTMRRSPRFDDGRFDAALAGLARELPVPGPT